MSSQIINDKGCCDFRIIDYSEPLIITGLLLGIGGFAMALVAGTTGMVVVTGVITVSSAVAEWRIRSLGIAKKLMDSVNVLQSENEELKENNDDLGKEIDRFNEELLSMDNTNQELKKEIINFKNIVGLLGDGVGDINQAQTKLFELYQKYKIENDKQQSNNLLTLFGLVDKNQDSRLSENELIRLKEYIRIVYHKEFDFSLLDKDNNGYISLQEFFEKFKLEMV